MPKKKEKKKLTQQEKLEAFKLKAFLKSTLRGAFRKTPMYNVAKNRAKVEYFVKSKHGKDMRRVGWNCAHCQRMMVDSKDVAVDHIVPVISDKYETLEGWILEFVVGLFCDVDNLQVLCNYRGERDGVLSCHSIKTKAERAKERV